MEKLARAILEAGTLSQVCCHPLGAGLLLAVMRSYPASSLAMLHWAATHLEAVLADANMVEAVILVIEDVLGKYPCHCNFLDPFKLHLFNRFESVGAEASARSLPQRSGDQLGQQRQLGAGGAGGGGNLPEARGG